MPTKQSYTLIRLLRSRWSLAMTAILILTCPVITPAFAEPLTFIGRVEKGERFDYPLDGGLMFRLLPNSAGSPPGWVITVARADLSRDDYVWVVTPPYRFWNPRYVDVSYGTSAREAVGITPREFAFVTNEDDYMVASESVDIILWPNSYKKKEVQAAQDKINGVPKRKGSFTITSADLDFGADGIQEIRSMEFKVRIE